MYGFISFFTNYSRSRNRFFGWGARFRPKRAEEYRNYNLSAQPYCAEPYKIYPIFAFSRNAFMFWALMHALGAPSSSHSVWDKNKNERLLLHRRGINVASTLISGQMKIESKWGVDAFKAWHETRRANHLSSVIACKCHFVIENGQCISLFAFTDRADNKCHKSLRKRAQFEHAPVE